MSALRWTFRWAADRRQVPRPVAMAIGRAAGTTVRSVLTGPEAIEAVLADPDVQVPYADRSAVLGVADFPLSLDGEAHGYANERIRQAIDGTLAKHQEGVVAAAERTAERLRSVESGDTIDVVAELIDPALQRWCEVWFGLEGEGPRLQQVGRATMHAMFLNPMIPGMKVHGPSVEAAVRELDLARDAWVGRREPRPEGTLFAALVGPGEPNRSHASDLVGLTVGPLALGSKTLAITVDELLARGALDAISGADRAAKAFDSVLVDRPPLPALPRYSPVPVCPAGQHVQVGVGHLFAVTTVASAARSQTFDPARWAFGVGPHACLGRRHITDVARALLPLLAARKPRRVEGEAGKLRTGAPPSGFGSWPFEAHLAVRFTA